MPRFIQSLLLCLTLAAFEQAQAAAPDTATVSFHTYGLIRGGGDAPRAIVAKRWHIEYRSVAGCLVTEGLIDSAKRHNEQTEAVLARRHGNDWQKRFDAEVAAETTRQQLITARLDSSAEVKALRSSLRKSYDNPWYHFSFDEQMKLYTVEVKAWDRSSGDYRTHYVLTAGMQRWELRRGG